MHCSIICIVRDVKRPIFVTYENGNKGIGTKILLLLTRGYVKRSSDTRVGDRSLGKMNIGAHDLQRRQQVRTHSHIHHQSHFNSQPVTCSCSERKKFPQVVAISFLLSSCSRFTLRTLVLSYVLIVHQPSNSIHSTH